MTFRRSLLIPLAVDPLGSRGFSRMGGAAQGDQHRLQHERIGHQRRENGALPAGDGDPAHHGRDTDPSSCSRQQRKTMRQG